MSKNRIDQPGYYVNFVSFLTKKTSTLHFLALVLFFEILLIVFIQPVHLLDYTLRLSGANDLTIASIAFIFGFLTLAGSRIIMVLRNSKYHLNPSAAVIWILAELIVCVGVMSLSLWLLSGKGKLMLAPLAGDITLGTLAVEITPYIISYLIYLLQAERSEVERLRALLPSEISSDQDSDHSVQFIDKNGRIVLSLERRNVLYIEAANNYVNIHYLSGDKENTYILHNSLKEIEQLYAGTSLVRCHRGYIVNADNVKLMRKDGMGLLLELEGTTRTIPVTKTYSDVITRLISIQ